MREPEAVGGGGHGFAGRKGRNESGTALSGRVLREPRPAFVLLARRAGSEPAAGYLGGSALGCPS